jgi:hypothetical protein
VRGPRRDQPLCGRTEGREEGGQTHDEDDVGGDETDLSEEGKGKSRRERRW